MRQIALDTETTGTEVSQGHRIIEIAGIELVNRRPTQRHCHYYLQPDRDIDPDAIKVHGLTPEFLQNKPRFSDIVQEFMAFIEGAELIIHNAPFDTGFLNNELKLLNQEWQPLEHYCQVIDTLIMARSRHPGQRNNLDALCKRYNVDNSKRQLHGALLDAELLAEVYLAMTGGQTSLLSAADSAQTIGEHIIKRITTQRPRLATIRPTAEEMQAHQQRLMAIDKASGGKCLWLTVG